MSLNFLVNWLRQHLPAVRDTKKLIRVTGDYG